jgi:hypothetical protein
MFALDHRLNSSELNRALFKVKNEEELQTAITLIHRFRATGDEEIMGDETISGDKKNDRIIPWMSIASFGWTLIEDKRSGDVSGYYTIPKRTMAILKEAAAIRHRHREFGSKREYVEHIARAACLPEDLR